jgi:hypothetical protein
MMQRDREPPFRRLRGYALDPSRSTQMETALINEVVFRVPWERLEPGPIGEYVEVVDYDPGSGCFYPPIDLDDPLLLAQDGLPPSEGNPQFHQQMVYAVAMTTIRNFERALGRRALWSERTSGKPSQADRFVRRLRLYPHALREANAFYVTGKKALLFGYFPADPLDVRALFPGGTVFTCLSHDIVAHETTHALLDGFHRSYIEPTHPDGLAFHEAFADLVALLQHFSFPDVVRHQIARQRGDLASQSLLGELAQEVGLATGSRGALRDALGGYDKDGQWKAHTPDPHDYETVFEPHSRGAILVGAVFDAFLTIYRTRVADLFRLATGGTGVLPAGAIHPDLVTRLADEAAKSAQHVLNMCVRALDYCPPVGLTFGEYLRAVVTADLDLVPDDDRRYRIAFIEAFRRRGIYPRNVRSLSVDSLRWQQVADREASAEYFWALESDLRKFVHQTTRRRATRAEIFERSRRLCGALHEIIRRQPEHLKRQFEAATGLVLGAGRLPEGLKADDNDEPTFEVRSCRAARRAGPDGDLLSQLVITITQRRRVRIDPERPRGEDNWFWFRGGATIILDLETLELQYAIRKRISSDDRLIRQRTFMQELGSASLYATYFGNPLVQERGEPIAFLHRLL